MDKTALSAGINEYKSRLKKEQNGIILAARVIITGPPPMAQQTLFICQPYVLGKNGGLKPQPPISYATQSQASLRAHRILDGGSAAGVDVVRQTADPDTGDYDDPVFLERLGTVPQLDS